MVIFFRIVYILLLLTLYRLKSVIVSLNVIHVALDHLLKWIIQIWSVVLDAVDPLQMQCLSIAMITFKVYMELVEEVTHIILLCHHLKHRMFQYNVTDCYVYAYMIYINLYIYNINVHRFTSRAWISLATGGSSWELRIKYRYIRRSGKTNSSPVTAMAEVVGVQHGCTYLIKIPGKD